MTIKIHTAPAGYRWVEFDSGKFWDKHNSERSQNRISDVEYKNRMNGTTTPWCSVCGAPLNPDRAQSVHIIGGGGAALHREDERFYTDDGGDMGCWDLGPECARLVPAVARQPKEIKS